MRLRGRGTVLVKGGPAPGTTVSEVLILSPPPISVEALATYQLTWVAQDNAGNVISGQSATYASSNEAVFTVNGTGLITGVGAGTATVSVTVAGCKTNATVEVTAAAGVVASVAILPIAASVYEDSTTVLTGTAFDASGNALVGKTMTWQDGAGAGDVTLSADSGTDPHTTTVTGVTAGDRAVTATCETIVSPAATVTVLAAGASSYPYAGAGLITAGTKRWADYANTTAALAATAGLNAEQPQQYWPASWTPGNHWSLVSDVFFTKCLRIYLETGKNFTSGNATGATPYTKITIPDQWTSQSRKQRVWLRYFVRMHGTNSATRYSNGVSGDPPAGAVSYKMFIGNPNTIHKFAWSGGSNWSTEVSLSPDTEVGLGKTTWSSSASGYNSFYQLGATLENTCYAEYIWSDNNWYEFIDCYWLMPTNTTLYTGTWRRRFTTGGLVSPIYDPGIYGVITDAATINGGWIYFTNKLTKAAGFPRWAGFDLGANKNKSNVQDNYIFWGPIEMVDGFDASNPYGVQLPGGWGA